MRVATHGRKNPPNEAILLRIEVEMMRRGWGVTDLATQLGVTPGLVSQWMTRRGEPGKRLYPRIASLFGMSVDRLLGRNLTPEEAEAERRYLERIKAGGARLAELLDAYDLDELLALLERNRPAKP